MYYKIKPVYSSKDLSDIALAPIHKIAIMRSTKGMSTGNTAKHIEKHRLMMRSISAGVTSFSITCDAISARRVSG